MPECPCANEAGENFYSDCPYLNAAYVFAGLAMMLNIRLAYSSAPYALIRFGLPENLFSVFVRRMASALELWCLPSMLVGNLMEIALKAYYELGGLTEPDGYGGKQIASGNKNPARLAKFWSIIIFSIISQWSNFLTYVILLIVYLMGGDQGHLTTFYWTIAISGVVFGINMVLLYAADYNYTAVYIAGENTFPILTSFIHYLTTLMFGNRRKWNSDFLVVCVDIIVAIIISFVAAVLWTVGYGYYAGNDTTTGDLKHIFAFPFGGKPDWQQLSPALMIVVGMGLVYAIYPGIAPGMIVPFYLVDKIEMVLLIATIFPPVMVVILSKVATLKDYSPKNFVKKWGDDNWFWHIFDIMIIVKITLAGIFIYSLHYRDSNISRAIINQPKMSTALSITFYMCHECLLALGFAGFIGNGGGDTVLIPQYIGALFMIFLAFYSEGYIIEYKSHDPAHWPIEGMWYLYGYYQLNPDFLL